MKFNLYTDVKAFKSDVYDILLEDEACNNLPIGILDGNTDTAANWLLSTVTDDRDKIVLIAMMTPRFNLLLIEPKGINNNGTALSVLTSGLKGTRFAPPGILAVSGLAKRFADVYGGKDSSTLKNTLVLMRLDKIAEYKKAPGFFRMLTEEDLLYAPAWEHEFCVDCSLPLYTPKENEDRIRSRLGKESHFVWIDGEPVSQAVHGRNTPNGAVISWVYTPPHFRGFGYATSVVAEASKAIFQKGKQFCCLFADTANPASQAVYRRLGYEDLCLFDEIKFDMKR